MWRTQESRTEPVAAKIHLGGQRLHNLNPTAILRAFKDRCPSG